MEIINNENILMYKVNKANKLFSSLKDELVLSFRQTNLFLRNGNILVNGKVVTNNINLNAGDIIKIEFEDESNEYEPENIPLEIIYESIDLLIINKPPKLVVHPTNNVLNHTLANAVAFYFNEIKLKRKIRFVNRLDMDTSGIIIVAKNSYSHQFLAKQFENADFVKKYLAIVSGIPKSKSGIIDEKLTKENNHYVAGDVGKDSVTYYNVLKEYKNYSLVECEIKTGRTHQIRVHLNSIGTPIIGDTFYGKESELIERMALHSYTIEFIEPRTNMLKKIVCELPDDMKKFLYA